MKIGLVGPSSQERSLPFDAQRTVNFYPVFDKEGKEVSALYGTPGLLLFATAGTGPIRGEYAATNGRCFAVSGSSLYEINSDGSSVARGSLDQNIGIVSMTENGFQLAICDGISVYIFTYATNAYQKVTDVDLPQSGTITFIDGYFVVNQIGTGKFFISALYDGLSWAALDFATAESSPDELIRVINAVGLLWLLGSKTGEIWSNTGASNFPFERISGAKMEAGILAAHTAVAMDNSLFWVGRDDNGSGIVFRANGFTPQRVSTNAIELLIQRAPSPETLRAYPYQQEGHTFYVLTGGGMDTTLVYDLSTQLWHERAYLNEDGAFELHRASCGMFAFNKQLVGDRENGNIYVLSQDVFSDNGESLASDRIYTHLSDEGKRIRFGTLEIDFEMGVGLQSGQGEDPQVMMRLSKDGGKTWSNWYTTTIGRVGKYKNKARFRRLGMADIMTFHIRITDPVKRAVCGSYLS